MRVSFRIAASFAACASLAACASSCLFDDHVDGGVIVCATTAACPSGTTCDEAAHVCAKPGETFDVRAPGLVSASFTPAFAGHGVVTLTVVADEPLASAAL